MVKITEPGLNKIMMRVRESQLFQVQFSKSICSGPVNCTQQMDQYCESSSDYEEMNTLMSLTKLFLLHDPNTSPAAKRSIFSPFLNLNRDSTMIKKDRNLTDPERRHYPGLLATKPEGNIHSAREEEQEELIEERKLLKSRTRGELYCHFYFHRFSTPSRSLRTFTCCQLDLGGGRQAENMHQRSQSNMMRCVPIMVIDIFR